MLGLKLGPPKEIMAGGWRNYLRRVPPGSKLYLPGLDGGNWFSGTIRDFSGNANHGTIEGATGVRLPSGQWFLDFDGIDDLVNCGSNASIANVFDDGGTALVWMNPASDGEADSGVIANKTGWHWNVQEESAGKVKVQFYQNFTTYLNGWKTAAVVPINTLSFVAVTYDSGTITNAALIYVNGVSVALTTTWWAEGSRVDDSANNLIRGNIASGTYTFDGLLGLDRIVGRILSASEIMMLYQQERSFLGV